MIIHYFIHFQIKMMHPYGHLKFIILFNYGTGLQILVYCSVLNIFSGVQNSHMDLKIIHVWGCPIFVLDPKIQDGQDDKPQRQGQLHSHASASSPAPPRQKRNRPATMARPLPISTTDFSVSVRSIS